MEREAEDLIATMVTDPLLTAAIDALVEEFAARYMRQPGDLVTILTERADNAVMAMRRGH